MAAIATCKFPLVDKFKDYGEKNPVVGFIDSIFSGFGQLVLSDNPVTGLLIMVGIVLGTPPMLLVAGTAAIAGTAFAYLIGVDRFMIRHGFFTFSAAIVGLGISTWGYSYGAVYPQTLIYAVIGGAFSVLVYAAVTGFLAKWEAPGLSIPYCVTLMVLIPSLLLMSFMHPAVLTPPALAAMTDGAQAMDLATFGKSVIIGVGEICFQYKLLSGFFLLLALLVSSRIDFLVAIICSAIGTGLAVALGLPMGNIALGLYGFNAALTGVGLFGRAFKMSLASALFTIFMVIVSVFVTVAMSAIFLPLGLPVAALPFGLIVVGCIIGKGALSKLTPVSILLWGVPETIHKALKDQEQQ